MADDSIPAQAVSFIVDEEDGSPRYYSLYETNFSWPGGASGPTIGVGYDLGYITAAQAATDWNGILSPVQIVELAKACGIRGAAAGEWVKVNRYNVAVTFDQAVAEFTQREIPKWVERVRAVLPNYDNLPALCRGALVSLAYNRGTGGFDDPGPRFSEMRAIKAFMLIPDFASIPAEFLSMRRLWPIGGDLWKRRTQEAALFSQGLSGS